MFGSGIGMNSESPEVGGSTGTVNTGRMVAVFEDDDDDDDEDEKCSVGVSLCGMVEEVLREEVDDEAEVE